MCSLFQFNYLNGSICVKITESCHFQTFLNSRRIYGCTAIQLFSYLDIIIIILYMLLTANIP